jgi:hypothetical protein
MKFNRIYHPYWDWEEIDSNMWGTVESRDKFLKKAIEFTGDHKIYGRFMMRVAREWPKSCENSLTDYSINRKAWIGHAACAMALGCPEDITRQAWAELTDEQRILANREAEAAIQYWEGLHAKSIGLCNQVESQMLF